MSRLHFPIGLTRLCLALVWSILALGNNAALAVEAGVTSALTPLNTFTQNQMEGAVTPRDQMRPMSVDSSFTIDPGHVQVEIDLAAVSMISAGTQHQLEASITPLTVRFGLTKNLDLHIGAQPFNVREATNGGRSLYESGFGDVVARLKWNLWGNEGGESAMALQPFLKIPTASQAFGNQNLELGLTIPYDVTLPGELSLAVSSTFELAHQGDALGYMPAVAISACLGRVLTEAVAGYVEAAANVESQEQVSRAMTIGAGITWTLAPDLLIDAGVGTSLLDEESDVSLTLSTAARF